MQKSMLVMNIHPALKLALRRVARNESASRDADITVTDVATAALMAYPPIVAALAEMESEPTPTAEPEAA